MTKEDKRKAKQLKSANTESIAPETISYDDLNRSVASFRSRNETLNQVCGSRRIYAKSTSG